MNFHYCLANFLSKHCFVLIRYAFAHNCNYTVSSLSVLDGAAESEGCHGVDKLYQQC